MKKKKEILKKIKLDSKINRFTGIKEIEVISLFYDAIKSEDDFYMLYRYAKNKKRHSKEENLLLEFGIASLLKASSSDFAIKLLLTLEDIDLILCLETLYLLKKGRINYLGNLVTSASFNPNKVFLEIAKYNISDLKKITSYFTDKGIDDILFDLISNYFNVDFTLMQEERKENNFCEYYSIRNIISYAKITDNFNMAMYILEKYVSTITMIGVNTIQDFELSNILKVILKKRYVTHLVPRISDETTRFNDVLEDLVGLYNRNDEKAVKIFEILISEIKRSNNASAAYRLVKVAPKYASEVESIIESYGNEEEKSCFKMVMWVNRNEINTEELKLINKRSLI